ncbi:HAD family hydrolase [uncultured Ruminococcus sp.]|uniref:HAD family hydrolase n=1 Tax=uncultured Ruminococcus sp. TaxID=165186 RepID=UPI00292E5E67|nr:HAD family hydrolase [uncultured Ruminococcus sp.]
MKHGSGSSATPWKVATGILAVVLAVVTCLYVINIINKPALQPVTVETLAPSTSDNAAINASTADSKKPAVTLSLWKDTAPLKKELTEYMKAITTEGSADFIPVENRIAVFDMDGTLCCETDPGYFDHKLLYHRVMEDPEYKDKASEEEIATCEIIKEYFDTGVYPEGLDVRHGQAVASAFKGMTPDEFDAYVKAYRDQPTAGYTNMTNGQAFYKPMLQVVEFLQANDFTVYIVSGTDRLITRGLCDGVINIPPSQMIGSDENFVATNQGDTDGLSYTFGHDDKLVTGGDFLIKNLKMNKVSVIEREIGVQPVLCFGNSSGDGAMANYTITNNKYKSGAFLLCCDDLERENGNIEKADKMRASCEENGWTAVSMKNDWTTIYGDGVTRIQQAAATEAATEAAELAPAA